MTVDPASSSHATPEKPVVGLLGGIGSGKSTVAAELERLGARVIDSDRLNDEQLANPEVIQGIVEEWGDRCLTASGSVDRRALAGMVFSDPEARKRLERLVHPRIERRRNELMERFRADDRCTLIVLNSPLLLEAGLDRQCNILVFIDSDYAARLSRVQSGRGWTREELDRREKMQTSLDIKRRRADYTIDNNTCLDRLRLQVQNLYPKLLNSGHKN